NELSKDIINTFLNTDEFAEDISYVTDTGVSRVIKAIVNRQRIKPSPENSGRILLNQVEIIIANDPENGLASINKGRDTFIFPALLGQTQVEWVVIDIIDHDQGAWHLLLEK
ncbi:MAG: hypothetical protein PHO42_06360, partial [Candidatus Omnitrophica bacterium]|nr:hypothetical protein [Candidatus Omnitrophota bacterium]